MRVEVLLLRPWLPSQWTVNVRTHYVRLRARWRRQVHLRFPARTRLPSSPGPQIRSRCWRPRRTVSARYCASERRGNCQTNPPLDRGWRTPRSEPSIALPHACSRPKGDPSRGILVRAKRGTETKLLGIADAVVYEAKSTGRNRTVVR